MDGVLYTMNEKDYDEDDDDDNGDNNKDDADDDDKAERSRWQFPPHTQGLLQPSGPKVIIIVIVVFCHTCLYHYFHHIYYIINFIIHRTKILEQLHNTKI